MYFPRTFSLQLATIFCFSLVLNNIIILGIHQGNDSLIRSKLSGSKYFPKVHQLASKSPIHKPVNTSYSNYDTAIPLEGQTHFLLAKERGKTTFKTLNSCMVCHSETDVGERAMTLSDVCLKPTDRANRNNLPSS